MTVTTVFATAPGGSGYAFGSSSSYATARSTYNSSGNDHFVGQNFTGGTTYLCYQSHIIFVTSGIADTDVVSDVVLSLDGGASSPVDAFTGVAAASAYNGGIVASGDWIDGDTLNGLTELATWDSTGFVAGYNVFTGSAAFNSYISLTGSTAIVVFGRNQADNVAPTGAERASFIDADAAGTTTDPKLDITHAAAAAGTVPLMAMMGVGT